MDDRAFEYTREYEPPEEEPDETAHPIESEVELWVYSIQEQYPELPAYLNEEIEQKYLEHLADWKNLVDCFRDRYERLSADALPKELQDVEGGRAVIPVLWALKYMSETEKEAWHRLFSCVSAQLGGMAHQYWKAHQSYSDSTLSLQDVLNYLPIVFLFVLGNFDADFEVKEYETDFSTGQGISLTTWVHIEARRHINKYMQSELYLVGNQANYMHRLRSKINRLQNQSFTSSGEHLSHTALVDEMESTYYGSHVSRSTLSKNIRKASNRTRSVSTDAPTSSSSTADGNTLRWGDTLSSTQLSETSEDNILSYFAARTASDETLQEAVRKVLTTDTPLSVEERFVFDN